MKHLPEKRHRDEAEAGPKPPDYLLIHKTDGGVRVQLCTHYVNHSGTWVSASGGRPVDLKWPRGKGVSKFVAVDLEDL